MHVAGEPSVLFDLDRWERAGIRHQTTHGSTDMGVDFSNLFNRRRVQQGAGQALFNCQDTAFLGLYSYRSRAQFDGFDCIFDLKGSTKQDTRISTQKLVGPLIVPKHDLYSMIHPKLKLTWKRRPSGEKVFTPRSYSDLVKYIVA